MQVIFYIQAYGIKRREEQENRTLRYRLGGLSAKAIYISTLLRPSIVKEYVL